MSPSDNMERLMPREENFIADSFQEKRARHATHGHMGSIKFWSGVRAEQGAILD